MEPSGVTHADTGRTPSRRHYPPHQQAADTYRRLAEDNPDRHLPALAKAVANLARRWDELGEHEEAEHAREEAANLRRQ